MYARVIVPEDFIRLTAERGFTVAELSKRSGVSYSLLKYVRAGQRQLSDKNAFAVADALDCHIEDFTTPKIAAPKRDAA